MHAAMSRLCILLTLVGACAGTNDAGVTFLEENAKKTGVVTLESGLQYKIIQSGPADGKTPLAATPTECHYAGTLIDGTEFDSR